MGMKNQQLESYMEQLTDSKLGKEYDKAVYYHLAYLSCTQCTSWETQAGVKMAGRNNNFRYADDTNLMAESKEELKSLLKTVKEENEKAGSKLNIQNAQTIASGPITSCQIECKKVKTVTDFIWGGGQKSL